MKSERHAKIREIITMYDIETQDDLVFALQQGGFQATQATVSRDIRELQLIKVPLDDGRSKYAMPAETVTNPLFKLKRALSDHFVHIDRAENLILLKCLPGSAQLVGSLVDQLKWKEIVGTISGDDTLMIVCRTKKQGDELVSKFLKMIP